jgi:hypothetical protein
MAPRRRPSCNKTKSLTRRLPEDSRRRWRRSGRAGARSGTARCAAMNEPVASFSFHQRPVEHVPSKGRSTENGVVPLTSRDVRENSNVRFVPRPIGSGIIATIGPRAEEIFSGDHHAIAQPRGHQGTVATTPGPHPACHGEASVRRPRSSLIRLAQNARASRRPRDREESFRRPTSTASDR